MSPIQTYIRERIDVMSNFKDTQVLTSLHIEIDNVKGKNRLNSANRELQNVISRIRSKEDDLKERIRIEF
jgi:hypothetical protein